MAKVKEKAWSVASQKMLERIKPDTLPELAAQIREQAADQARSDIYGASWRERVNADGTIAEDGIGSTEWLVNVEEARAERHFAAIERFHGPGAARAERERIARLKAARK